MMFADEVVIIVVSVLAVKVFDIFFSSNDYKYLKEKYGILGQLTVFIAYIIFVVLLLTFVSVLYNWIADYLSLPKTVTK